MTRRWATFIVGLLYVCGVVYASLSLLRPAPPPPLPKAEVVRPALTQHLLFLIVDGLRFDVATDPALMPRFSQAMRQHRSADIMAGPVSMTSSAIQAFATGQRGRLEQIARNINPDPPPFQSWMQNARAGGLRVALVGDRTWRDAFGKHFDEMLLDPPGVAIDYDYNAQTFRDARVALAHSPNALILHFVTPDHQGHAYGVRSSRYRAHIQGFDRMLFELLAELDSKWTVVVTSDHGANDAGDHGGGVLIHRRSPIFAYGPGIAPPHGPSPRLDQIDVAGTLSALLGVPAPCHSQGHLLTDWLALPDAERAAIAVADVERALRFARVGDAEASDVLAATLARKRATLAADPARLVVEARGVARQADALLKQQQGVFSPRAWWSLGAITLGALLVSRLLLGKIPPVVGLGCGFLAIASVALTAQVERLPGTWPKLAPALLFGLLNLPTLLLLLRPERFVALLDRLQAHAPAVVPGLLAATYPRNLQPVAFAVALIVPLVILGSDSPSRWGVSFRASARDRRLDLLLMVAWGLSLFPAGWFPDGLPSLSLVRHTSAITLWGLSMLAALLWELCRRAPEARNRVLALGAVVTVSFLVRPVAPAWLGRPALLLLPVLALWPLARGRYAEAVMYLFAGYAWVSRSIELPTVAAALGSASLVGRRSGALVNGGTGPGRWLTLLAFWFTLAFVLRLGVSGGIDPTHLDLAAGSFGDQAVSAPWVGFCVVWKNLLVFTALGLILQWSLDAQVASKVARGFAVIYACRMALLLAMMQFAQGSFWTSMRVIGELPYAALFFVSAGASWFGHALATRTAASTAPTAQA